MKKNLEKLFLVFSVDEIIVLNNLGAKNARFLNNKRINQNTLS